MTAGGDDDDNDGTQQQDYLRDVEACIALSPLSATEGHWQHQQPMAHLQQQQEQMSRDPGCRAFTLTCWITSISGLVYLVQILINGIKDITGNRDFMAAAIAHITEAANHTCACNETKKTV